MREGGKMRIVESNKCAKYLSQTSRKEGFVTVKFKTEW